MAVMELETGSVTPHFPTEGAEVRDVTFKLRHLHRILHECHSRVEWMDRALDAKNGETHEDAQNIKSYHNLKVKHKADINIQEENCSGHQVDIEREYNTQEKNMETVRLKEQNNRDAEFRIKHKEDLNGAMRTHLDQSTEKSVEEKYSTLEETLEDQEFSVSAGNNINECVDSDSSSDPKDKNDLSNTTINYELMEHSGFQDVMKKDQLDGITLLGTKQNKYMKRQQCVDIDDSDLLLLTDHDTDISSDKQDDDEVKLMRISTIMADSNGVYSDRISEHKNLRGIHRVEDNTHTKYDKINSQETKENGEFNKYHEYNASKTSCRYKNKGEMPLVTSNSEVIQMMDVIWKTLGNLHSEFHSLHSSIADSSNLKSKEFAGASRSSFGSITDTGKVSDLKLKDLSLDDHTEEAIHVHQPSCEQYHQRKSQLEHYPTPSQTLTSCGRSKSPLLFQKWGKSCLSMLIIVLLMFLLFLFCAACVLIVLPHVSVTVNTEGTLPAF